MCKYVVLDLEMCRIFSRLHPDIDLRTEIIQLGAVVLNESYEIIDSFNTFVSPQFGSIDKKIKRLTGITYWHVKDAPNFKDVIECFFKWVPKDAKFVAWSESDEKQLRDEMFIKDIEISEFDDVEWIDCQMLFSDKLDTAKNYSLAEAVRLAMIDFEEQEHDALIDAINTAKLFKKINTEETLKLNEYYLKEEEVDRSTYTPFADLLKDFCFES